MKKKQFLWLMIAIGILSTGSGCDTVKPVSTTQEIPTAEETNLVTTAPVLRENSQQKPQPFRKSQTF